MRKSNRGAIRLYEEHQGYKVAGVAPAYYSDGEDAFLMQAELPVKSKTPATQVRARLDFDYLFFCEDYLALWLVVQEHVSPSALVS